MTKKIVDKRTKVTPSIIRGLIGLILLYFFIIVILEVLFLATKGSL